MDLNNFFADLFGLPKNRKTQQQTEHIAFSTDVVIIKHSDGSKTLTINLNDAITKSKELDKQ